MSAAAFLRVKKLKGGGIIKVAARHNKREIQAELGADSHIDPARTRLNETLQGAATPDDVAQLAKDLMRDAGIAKLRKDAVMGLELVFSLPPMHRFEGQDNDRTYFSDCATWAGAYFGGAQNILSVDIHRDEAAPHCHVLMLPLLDNRMDGSNMLGGKQKLQAMQKDFYDSVASRYGLKKAPTRLSGGTKQAAAKAILQRLRETSDTVLTSQVWAALREAIERDPAPFLIALGLEIDRPKKPLRSMAAIFTSKGKGGSKQADNNPNPIGFAVPVNRQTLCSVGFADKPLPVKEPERPIDPQRDCNEVETVRVRESELDPALFDPVTGEFFKRPQQPKRGNRAAADAWVIGAVNQRGLDSVSPPLGCTKV